MSDRNRVRIEVTTTIKLSDPDDPGRDVHLEARPAPQVMIVDLDDLEDGDEPIRIAVGQGVLNCTTEAMGSVKELVERYRQGEEGKPDKPPRPTAEVTPVRGDHVVEPELTTWPEDDEELALPPSGVAALAARGAPQGADEEEEEE